MRSKPIVLCDVDGVIADFVSEYLQEAGFQFSPFKPFHYEQVTEWDIGKALGLTGLQAQRVETKLGEERVAAYLRPYPGAVELVKELQVMSDLVFVTSPFSPARSWCHDRNLWLKKHFGDDVKVIHTKHKEYVVGDYLIDDRPDNITAWLEGPAGGTGLLIKRPWNQGTLTLEQAVSFIKDASR